MRTFFAKTTLLSALLICVLASYSQTVYKDWLDGAVYVKYKNDFIIPNYTHLLPANTPGIGEETANRFGIYKTEASFSAASSLDLQQTIRISFNKIDAVDEMISLLSKLPYVEYAEKVPYLKLDYTPNDLGSNSATGTGQWSLWKIKAQNAWNYSKGDSNIVVAVVDDEVSAYHPDLYGNMWRNPGEIAGNKIDDDGNGYIDDIYGWDAGDNDNDPVHPNTAFTHGTHVSGIISAVTDNGIGVASIGFNLSIMGVKCTNNSQTNTASIPYGYEGLTYAANAGADIINLSWSSGVGSTTAENTINYVLSKGCMILAAASNDGVNQIRYPASYNGVIAVASTGQTDAKSSFSNYGTWVDISAPGEAIRSTVTNNTYNNLSGTSMATPLTAGLAGLMKSYYPNISNATLQACLLSTADNISSVNSGLDGLIGSGRINAERAMQCIDTARNKIPTAKVLSSVTVSCPNTLVNFFATSTGGPIDNVKWYFPGGNPSVSTAKNPIISYPAAGKYDVSLVLTNNAGKDSVTLKNYIDISSMGRETVYSEDFESGTLTAKGFTLVNPDASTTWAITNAGGAPSGSKAVYMNFYSYNKPGQRDGLVLPPLNLTKRAGTELTFIHAHRRQNTTKRDSLIVYVSLDSGKSFPYRVFAIAENGNYNFATMSPLATNFIPSTASNWCYEALTGAGCLKIDLSNFDGNPDVRIMLEGYNDYGNNLFIDNIKVTAFCAAYNTKKPVAKLSTSNKAFCVPQTVHFDNLTENYPDSSFWYFEGGTPAFSTDKNPDVSYTTPGVYKVKLVTKNNFGADSVLINSYINASGKPVLHINTPKTSICRGESVQLIITGAKTYLWQPVFAISDIYNDTVTVSPSTSIQYKVTATNDVGCSDTTSVYMNVFPGPGSSSISQKTDTLISSASNVTYQWYFNTNKISGAEGKEYVAPLSGYYYVVLTDSNNCKSTSPTHFYIALSSPETGKPEIKVYPNPAGNELTIDFNGNSTPLSIAFFDMLGKEVLAREIIATTTLDISTLSEGVYILQVQQGESITQHKIAIKK